MQSETHGHFFEQCFEDMKPRLKKSVLVIDTSHISMCAEYYQQPRKKYKWMRYINKNFNKIPKSLESFEYFLELSREKIFWFHLSEATGFEGKDEGKEIGTPNGLIDWKWLEQFIQILENEGKKVYGVIEIVDSHKDYSKIQKSIKHLKKYYPGMI